MFRGVTDLNLNFLRNWGFHLTVSHHVFRPIGVRTAHGVFTPSYVSPLCAALSFQLSNQDVFASRSISLHGLRTIDLSREPARHRNLSARSPSQALSSGHSRQYRQEHTGRCQRISRLAYLPGFRTELNPDSQNTLCQRPLCCGTGTDGLRTRYHDDRSLLERLPLGTLPSGQSSGQDAYAARPARQYSNLHPHQRRQDARGQCARHPDTRSGQLLHHGSGLHRFRPLVHSASSTGVLRYSWQIQSALSAHLLAHRGQVHWASLRSDHCVVRSQGQQGLPATPSTYQVLRCRTRQASGLSDQQLRLARADYRSTLPQPLAGRVILQVDQQHLRIKKFYGTTENAVKTQIWIAITVYVLVAIVKKRLNTEASLYTILQILSLTLFEKIPLDQLLKNTEIQMTTQQNNNQLNLFD